MDKFQEIYIRPWLTKYPHSSLLENRAEMKDEWPFQKHCGDCCFVLESYFFMFGGLPIYFWNESALYVHSDEDRVSCL